MNTEEKLDLILRELDLVKRMLSSPLSAASVAEKADAILRARQTGDKRKIRATIRAINQRG